MPVVISETLARELFGTADAVGSELRLPFYGSSPKTARVIGVAHEAHYGAIDSPPDAVLYEPISGLGVGLEAFVLARSDVPGLQAARRVAEILRKSPGESAAPIGFDRCNTARRRGFDGRDLTADAIGAVELAPRRLLRVERGHSAGEQALIAIVEMLRDLVDNLRFPLGPELRALEAAANLHLPFRHVRLP